MRCVIHPASLTIFPKNNLVSPLLGTLIGPTLEATQGNKNHLNSCNAEVSHLKVYVALHLSVYPPRLQTFLLLDLISDTSCAGIYSLHRTHSVPAQPGAWQIQIHDGCGCHWGKGKLDTWAKLIHSPRLCVINVKIQIPTLTALLNSKEEKTLWSFRLKLKL